MRAGARALTTEPGFTNENGQTVVASTGARSGKQEGQRIYRLRCGSCGAEYGANGLEIHQRLCPACQGGLPGETLIEAQPKLF